jgi:hypothetical protein
MKEDPIPTTILPPIYIFRDVAKNSTITPAMMITDPMVVGQRLPSVSDIQPKKIKGIMPPMALEAPKKPRTEPSGWPNRSCQVSNTCIPFVMDSKRVRSERRFGVKMQTYTINS